MKLSINGFGRIGRAAFKIALDTPNIDIVAVNDLTNHRVLAHLLKYDSAYGIFDKAVWVEEDDKEIKLTDYRGEKDFFTTSGKENYIVIEGKRIKMLAEKDPSALPWGNLGVDVVLECTGLFTENDTAEAHIKAGAKRVVISAPTKGGTTEMFLIGVNDQKYAGQDIVSNASCTTNCISPVIAVVHNKFRVLKSAMTTIHAITSGQNIVDGPPNPRKPDLRRARAAGFNMIPTTTGAAKATTQVIPELAEKFDGISIRVPIITGSVSDITMLVESKTSVEEVNQAFVDAVKDPTYKNVLAATYEPLVSSDIVGTPFSAIVDLSMTKVIDGDLVKILAWYDNEWGYSHRLVEMAMLVGNHD